MTTKKTAAAIALWLAAIGVAMCLDRAVALYIRQLGIDEWLRAHRTVAEVLKFPGSYGCTVIVMLIVAATHAGRWHAALFVFLATLMNSINRPIQWAAGRKRPFKFNPGLAEPFTLVPANGGWHGFFNGTNLCFPSGHAGLAFATAVAVAMLWPRSKWRWIAYVLALVTALERVAENAHWLSDVVAGAALGVGGVYLVAWIVPTLLRKDAELEGSKTAS